MFAYDYGYLNSQLNLVNYKIRSELQVLIQTKPELLNMMFSFYSALL